MGFKKKGKPSLILSGALGFVGSNVASRLTSLGYDSFNIDNLQFGSENNASGEWHKMGFECLTQEQLDEYDILIHLATSNIIYSQTEPIKTFKTNALDTINLFRKFKGKIIYTSTASIFGMAKVFPTPEDAEPDVSNAYDMSKLVGEIFLQQRGNYTTLRLSNVFGRNQRPGTFCGVIGKLLDQALNDKPMEIIGDGSQTRDYTFVEDVVDAIELAVNKPALNTEINIATGIETSVKSLAIAIASALDKTVSINSLPLRSIDSLTRRCLDIRKAKSLLNWEPKHTLKSGLQKTIEWMQGEMLKDEIHKHFSSTHSVRVESDEAKIDLMRIKAGLDSSSPE